MPTKKTPAEPVVLCAHQRVDNFMVRNKKERVFFKSEGLSEKDIIKAAKAERGIGWGIGAYAKIYRVGPNGEQAFLFTLAPQVRETFNSRGGRNIRTLAKPMVIYQENWELTDGDTTNMSLPW